MNEEYKPPKRCLCELDEPGKVLFVCQAHTLWLEEKIRYYEQCKKLKDGGY
jgi:hypothetical protein